MRSRALKAGLVMAVGLLVAGVLPADAAAAPGQNAKGKANPGAANKPAAKPAAKPASRSNLVKIDWGHVWSGPDIDEDTLYGKLVVVHVWTYPNAQSGNKAERDKRKADVAAAISALTGMKALATKYHKAGLVVIGVFVKGHGRGATLQRMMDVVKVKRVPYSICAWPPGRANQLKSGLRPGDAIIYDHAGSVAYAGAVNSTMARQIKELLGSRPHPILGARELKKLSLAAGKVKAARYGEAWQNCKQTLDDAKADDDAKAEATYLQERLDADAERLLAIADDNREASPKLVVKVLTRLRRQYAGCPHGEKATATWNDLSKDRDFKLELAAQKGFEVIRAQADGIPRCPTDKAQQPKWMSEYGRKYRDLKNRVLRLKGKCPDAWYTQQAEGILHDLAPA